MAALIKFRQNTTTHVSFLSSGSVRYLDRGVLRDESRNRIVIGGDRIIVAEQQPVFDIPVDFRNKESRFCICFRQ